MSSKRYTDEFRQEAVKQVTERGHKVADVATRLGVSTYIVKDRKKEIGPGLLKKMLTDLGLDKSDIEQ